MKRLVMILCILSPGIVTRAQQPARPHDPPGLAIVKFSWSKERVGWSQDPFSGPIENFDEMRVRARNEKRILDAKKGSSGAEVNKAERDARTDDALISSIHRNKVARYGFLYKVSLENNGPKPIKSIDWDYVFFDTNTQSELGRRQFTSAEKIAPNKKKELSFFIRNPPTQTISIDALDKNERANLGELVVIVRVEYSDGSIWEHP
jgi:hypothetical protein